MNALILKFKENHDNRIVSYGNYCYKRDIRIINSQPLIKNKKLAYLTTKTKMKVEEDDEL